MTRPLPGRITRAQYEKMYEMQQEMDRAASLLKTSDNILVLAHRSVDGDAYGSSMALAFSLGLMGKNVRIANEVPIASEHHFLGHAEEVEMNIPMDVPFDCVVVCDCGEYRRIGRFIYEQESLFRSTPIINFDHHMDNDGFGTINIVNSEASSTCEILAMFLSDHGFPIEDDIRTFLLYGILRDTNCFKNSMGPETLRVADTLRRQLPTHSYGWLVTNAFKTIPIEILGICAEAFLEPIVLRDGEVVGCVITQDMLDRAGLDEHEFGDFFINEFLPSIRGANYVFQMKRTREGFWKISFRARVDGYDVSKLARKLGGGGHYRSAAALSPLSLEEIVRIIEETEIREQT